MAQFFVPLFLACVLLVIFEPLQRWMNDRFPARPRVAAMATTIAIILVVVLPLVYLGWKAYVDFYVLLHRPVAEDAADVGRPAPQVQPPKQEQPDAKAAAEQIVIGEPIKREELTVKLHKFTKRLVDPIAKMFDVEVPDTTIARVVGWASGFAAQAVITGLQSTLGIIVGLFILVVALYYFLADGPLMVEAAMALSPLDRRYEQELLQRFAQISRAVVVATLLTALTQGALAGIGYAFALPKEAPIFLLTALTTVCALVPFFGAFAVWATVCIWLYAVAGETVSAIVLAVYCTFVVSMIDNIMKPLILHGQSKLHPLLALLSILGGIHAFGPVGILVGPMLVSFLQALLNMLRKEIESFGESGSSQPLAASMAEALQMAAASESTLPGGITAAELAEGNASSAKPSQAPAKSRPFGRGKRKR
jgi:predicted PurR-regulated permease PerM